MNHPTSYCILLVIGCKICNDPSALLASLLWVASTYHISSYSAIKPQGLPQPSLLIPYSSPLHSPSCLLFLSSLAVYNLEAYM